MSLIAVLSLSAALSGSWKSSAPGEASAELLLMEGHCTLLCRFGYHAVRYHCPQYPQCSAVGTGQDGEWMPTSPAPSI